MNLFIRRLLLVLTIACLIASDSQSQVDTPPGSKKSSGNPGKNVNYPR
jgi:hypothetical protein